MEVTRETQAADKATVVIHNAILELLSMFSKDVSENAIMSGLYQAAGTLAGYSIRAGATTREDWHKALDMAIDLSEINEAGGTHGSVS